MCAGEPDFGTPEHIVAAAVTALQSGQTRYTPVAGIPALRAAIAAKLEHENRIPCTPDQVVVAPGAKFSVFTAVAVLCSAGDDVAIPAPFWLSYPEMVRAAGARPVPVPTAAGDGFAVRPETLRAHLTDATRLLILNSPGNPTGAVCTADTLNDLAELAIEKDFYILADEIYEKLVYDGTEHVSIASISPAVCARTITVNGFSKSFAMTGWRLGYLAGPLPVVKRIAALQSHTTSNATSFAQAGALAALQGPQDCVETMRRAFEQRRTRICERLSAIPGITVVKPCGAFYIFPDISAYGLDSMTFSQRLLDEQRVAVIPGKPFGADTHVRLSYACDLETIDKACTRFAEFCASLNRA